MIKNYNPHTWKPKETIITEKYIDQIEDGIDIILNNINDNSQGLISNINTLETDFNTTLTENLNNKQLSLSNITNSITLSEKQLEKNFKNPFFLNIYNSTGEVVYFYLGYVAQRLNEENIVYSLESKINNFQTLNILNPFKITLLPNEYFGRFLQVPYFENQYDLKPYIINTYDLGIYNFINKDNIQAIKQESVSIYERIGSSSWRSTPYEGWQIKKSGTIILQYK